MTIEKNFSIENEYLCVEISSIGAELIHLINKQTNVDVLWNADPHFWPRHAPILFPNVGRTWKNTVKINDIQYPTKQHGFARDSLFTCAKVSDTKIICTLQHTAETLLVFPFPFSLSIQYEIVDMQLNVSYRVHNPGKSTMYFTIGGHPGFRFEKETETKQDYCLYFKDHSALRCTPIDISTGTAVPESSYTITLDNGYLPLHDDLFANDALVLDEHQISSVSICHSDHTPYLTFLCNGFCSFGIWSVKDAPYVCLEPWAGRCDNTGFASELSTKPGINTVHPGNTFKCSYTIILK